MPDTTETTIDAPATGAPESLEDALKLLADARSEADKWKAMSRQNEARSKDNADKAKKFDELEEQSKSELEKAIARAEAAEKLVAEREAREAAAEMAREIAATAGLPDGAAAALSGTTREELERHAELLKSLIPPKPAVPSAEGQGNTGDDIGDGELSVDDIVAAATSR